MGRGQNWVNGTPWHKGYELPMKKSADKAFVHYNTTVLVWWIREDWFPAARSLVRRVLHLQILTKGSDCPASFSCLRLADNIILSRETRALASPDSNQDNNYHKKYSYPYKISVFVWRTGKDRLVMNSWKGVRCSNKFGQRKDIAFFTSLAWDWSMILYLLGTRECCPPLILIRIRTISMKYFCC